MDDTVKKQFDAFCSDVGMNASVAVNLFAKAVIREKRIPFEIASNEEPFYSATKGATASIEQRQAMQEIRDLLAGVDGNSVDLDQMRTERRAAKFERND
jgi:addiction module RelB/DinJ family antitoxin